MGLPSPNALRAFETIGRHDSFRDAAKELNVSVGSVTRYIQLLEEQLGIELFERHSHGVTLSPAGLVYHRAVSDAFNNLRDVTDKLCRHMASGQRHLVWCQPAIGAYWLAPRMDRIRSRLGELELYLSVRVPYSDITYKKIDFAIIPDYFAPRGSDNFRCERLYLESFMPVCSPRLLNMDLPLRTPLDLVHHPLLVYPNISIQWNDWIADAGIETISEERRVYVNNGQAAYQLAKEGYGIALGERMKLADSLRRRELVTPFNIFTSSQNYMCLYWRKHPLLDKMAKNLIDTLMSEVHDTLGDGVDPHSADWPAGLMKPTKP